MKDRRRYSAEFKLAAAKKVIEQGLTVREVARDLGINANLLYTWLRQFEKNGSLKPPPATNVEEELRRLREENRRLKMEQEILKKATAFFAKNPN